MSIIRITKEFNFEAAHALWNYKDLCKNIHGHSYRLLVTVTGIPITNKNNSKYGMLMDFNDLKAIVKKNIIDVFDHSLIIFKEANTEALKTTGQMFNRLILTDYQPTCENMVNDFALRIKKLLPTNVKLHNLKLFETVTSYAEWFAEDNL